MIASKIKDLKALLDEPLIVPQFLKTKHIPSLDGWRAVAVLIVILGHFMLTLEKDTFFHSVLRLTIFGILGVKIFFVISGFLITTLLIKEKIKNGRINILNFFIRRTLRIIPVLYLYLTVIYILNSILKLNLSISYFIAPLLYINNFNLLSGTWLTGHTWSLSVEEQFYLIWPFMFKYFKNLTIACLIIVLFFIPFIRVSEYLNPEISNYILAPFIIPASSIFTGVLLSLVSFNNKLSIKFIENTNCYKFGLFLFSIIIIYINYYLSIRGIFGKFTLTFGNLITDLSIGYLILFSIIRKNHILFKILNNKTIVQIGVISYSLYIWQQLFIIPKGNYPILEHYIHFPINLILVFVFGYVSYYYFEKPFLKLKEKFVVH